MHEEAVYKLPRIIPILRAFVPSWFHAQYDPVLDVPPSRLLAWLGPQEDTSSGEDAAFTVTVLSTKPTITILGAFEP